MTTAALVIFAVYLAAGFGFRTWVQYRRTGDSGFRGISGRPGTPEWWAGILFAVAVIAGVMGPVSALLSDSALAEPVAALSWEPLHLAGLVLALAGLVGTLLTQLEMGTSWRIGVDADERTDLVTSGAFSLARNPIFAAMAATGLGLALMVPNVVSVLGFVLLVVALELQVRVVEEPYLRATHGTAYQDYASVTGRFLPRIGRTGGSGQRPETLDDEELRTSG